MILLVLVLVVIGVLLELLKSYLTIDGAILTVIRLVIVVCVVFYVLTLFGIADLPVPRVR